MLLIQGFDVDDHDIDPRSEQVAPAHPLLFHQADDH